MSGANNNLMLFKDDIGKKVYEIEEEITTLLKHKLLQKMMMKHIRNIWTVLQLSILKIIKLLIMVVMLSILMRKNIPNRKEQH